MSSRTQLLRVIRGCASRVAAASLLLASSACSASRAPSIELLQQSAPAAIRTSGPTDHVVVISIDGLRPDAIERFGAATLQRLMREGSYTLGAQTVLPSKTLPSHASMLSGVEPDAHGLTWNDDRSGSRGTIAVPTVFSLASDAGLRAAAFFSKTKFYHLETREALAHSAAPSGEIGAGLREGVLGRRTAERTLEELDHYLDVASPNLVFVHIGEPDFAGHSFGWMGRLYGRAVQKADRAVAEVLADADRRFGAGQYAVIVTSDHGGHGRSHGSADPRDTTIPWIIWGEGVRALGAMASPVRTTDTAATALRLLGVQAPVAWTGRPALEALAPRSSLAAQP